MLDYNPITPPYPTEVLPKYQKKLAGLHTTRDMAMLPMAGLLATWGKVKHFVARNRATTVQRVKHGRGYR